MDDTNNDKLKVDKLGRPLVTDLLDKSLWSDKCDYVNIDDCTNLNPENYNFIFVQHNIQSILAHQTELQTLLQELKNKNSPVDVVTLSETFLMKKVRS